MLAVLYLFLCFTTGWAICTYAFPNLRKVTEADYDKRKISVSPFLLLIPTWYVTGTLVLTWATYLTAYLNEMLTGTREPLIMANAIVMPLALVISVMIYYDRIIKQNKSTPLFIRDRKTILTELFLLAGITILACVLMWTTFFVNGDKLYVGVSVFSDFSPHIGMIRSFSYGNNFPTAYSHYAGEDIRYHFMFQFLVGNLEFLGMRIDYAFNIPSILCFISAFLFLYLLAVKITGKIGAGLLACLFFAFRSSKALFTYLSKLPEGTNPLTSLRDNTNFIGETPHEDWGLWNLNVYCNQRHLALGLAVFLFIIILLLPNLYEMFEKLRQFNFHKPEQKRKNYHENIVKTLAQKLKVIFFTKEAWLAKDIRLAIACGILLGSLAFFHGAALIGCLAVLFVVAALSDRRLEFVIVAVISMGMSLIQTHFFIHGSVVSTKILFGFIAENKTIFGVAAYLGELLGILPVVLLASFCLERGIGRYLILAFSAPLIFALTVSLTVDVTVNHKYIMMSCILLGIFAAALVMKLFERKDFLLRIVGIFLIVLLTATGIYDFTTVLKKNTPASDIVLNLNDPLTAWIHKNSDSQDIYLSSNYALNQVVLGGAMLYEGWPYFPWSAGYDTDYRTNEVKKMYEAQTPRELIALVKKNKIRYIIVDQDNRESKDYKVNEDNIKATYKCSYSSGTGEVKLSVYDTKELVK